MNSRRDLYGAERLIRTAKVSRALPPKGIIEKILKDVRSFEPQSTQHDDITVIALKIV